ncbi:MAG: CARDB domain-containing protein [Candidatus Altiarchaeota archaeon]
MRRRGQVSLELIMTVAFVLLIFLVVVSLALEKNSLANNMKLYLDARSVTESFASNINTISEQSSGYYRYVSFPSFLYGRVDYNLSSARNFVSIQYKGSEWVAQTLASNITIHCISKGLDNANRFENTGDAIIVTCQLPNIAFMENSFRASSSTAGENTTLTVLVKDRSHVNSGAFIVAFNNTDNYSVSSLTAGDWELVSYDIVAPAAGTHNLYFMIDSGDSVNESIESDNALNVSWITV